MRFAVALTQEADSTSSQHLLQHFEANRIQEDLCFAVWRPSTGDERTTALIDEIILPENGERLLHGNASFTPDYMARALSIARKKNAGLAFMHSHPSNGWQGMSEADVRAERDILGYPAGATGLPLVGLTIGKDGFWSSRFWQRQDNHIKRQWCESTRILGASSYRIHFNDDLIPRPRRRNILRRTYDTWGEEVQNTISRLRVGIVGLGSVGCIVAEALARIGIESVVLVDHDHVEEHNLDRLLYGTEQDVGKSKVDVAAREIARHSTATQVKTKVHPNPVQGKSAYGSLLDCDVIFSCVDRPVPRDVLNFVANAHLIPVIDGGIAVEVDNEKDKFFSAHWRTTIVSPYHRCMRCSGQYDSSMVITELDGSLDDPSYIRNLPAEERVMNQNVFPFSQSLGAMEINLLLRYLVGSSWWPSVQYQTHYFVTGHTEVGFEECKESCVFRSRRAKGDSEVPFYLSEVATAVIDRHQNGLLPKISNWLGRVFRTR